MYIQVYTHRSKDLQTAVEEKNFIRETNFVGSDQGHV